MLAWFTEIAIALAATAFYIVGMPVLFAGGFFVMMHGANVDNDTIAMAGLALIPAGWLALAFILKQEWI